MKRYFSLLLCLALCCALFACGNPIPELTTAESTNALAETTTEAPIPTDPSLPVYVPGSIKLDPSYDYSDSDYADYKRSYRVSYYQIPVEFVELAGADGYDYIETAYSGFISEPPFMLLADFAEHFEIPKEQFVHLLDVLEASWIDSGCDISSEEYELPNADIIYTFDNEIINEYYRRQ